MQIVFNIKMYKFVVIFVLAAVMVQDSECCCSCSREPYMSKTCLECLFDLCPTYAPPKCGCSCFKDLANPCACNCNPCACNCNPCGGSRSLYFPEVEYPVTGYNINPFYYGSCFGCGC